MRTRSVDATTHKPTGFLRSRSLGAVALLTGAVAALSSCGSSTPDAPDTAAASSSATSSNVALTDASMRKMVAGLAGSAQGDLSSTQVACLTTTVRDSDLSDQSLRYMVAAPEQDRGSLIAGLRENVSPEQAQILLAQDLRDALDECVEPASSPSSTSKTSKPKAKSATKSAPSKTSDKSSEKKTTPKPKPKKSATKPTAAGKNAPGADADPNFKPRYKVSEKEDILSASQLQPGLVSMFSSYAIDAKQSAVYKSAGKCMAKAVLDADLSQESLRFIAGGAPISTGSIAEHLPNKADQKIWNSGSLTSDLSQCISSASTDPA